MRGDSRQDLYAKSLAVFALGLLAGVGALVDYWPTNVQAPRPVGTLMRLPPASGALAVPSRIPTLTTTRTAFERRARSHAQSVAGVAMLDSAMSIDALPRLASPVLTAPPPAKFDAAFDRAAAPSAQRVPLSEPTPVLQTSDDTDETLRQFSGSGTNDTSFISDAFHSVGGSIAYAGNSIVSAGVKTGQSVAGVLRAAAGAVKKLKFF